MTKRYTVKQVAVMAGVSIRTLHHYDALGLLKPAVIGGNGYRYYGEAELLRLHSILLHRELDMPLAEIALLLDLPEDKRIDALRRQRDRLDRQAARFVTIARSIDRAIARMEGVGDMSDQDLYAGLVSPDKQALYEAWLVERFGPGMAVEIERSRDRPRLAGSQAELAEIEQALAEGLRRSIPIADATVGQLIERHRDWVAAQWGRPCPPSAHAGLAEVYAHPDFQARYEVIAPGFADYLISAMRHWGAARCSS